jgi:hypothetical protein
MRRLTWAIVVSIAALSCARAQAVNLICGLDLISIDLVAKLVTFEHAILDETTRQLYAETYRDGYTYTDDGKTVVQFVTVDDDAITFGATRWITTINGVLEALWRLDRRTGILIAKPPNRSDACVPAPPRRLF